jgi:hypothetical protein
MHIRRLARKAVFITAAVMVLVGFSAGIAGTASAAPASHVSAVSAVASAGTTVPKMPVRCPNEFCTIGIEGRYVITLQTFRCSPHGTYHGIINPIYVMQNNCSFRVYYFDPGTGCVSPHSSKGQSPFPTVDEIFVSTNPSRC